MKFLHPYFLFLLLAIIIPILIHLFNFRRYKTVFFSNVEFLKNIKKESKKKSRIKQLLILLARIFAIVFIVLAFAQPFIPTNNNKQNTGQQAVAIYVDNSFSMNINAEEGLLIEIARNKAAEIAREYSPGTKFILCTNDLLAKHKHYFSKEEFIQQVSEIRPTAKSTSQSQAYKQIINTFDGLDNKTSKTIYFLSDFQRHSTDLEQFKTDTTIFSYFFPIIPTKVNNLYIDSCWFETPGRKQGEEELFVKIINSADEDYQNLPLNFYLNDTLKAINNFNINAQSEIIVSLNYSNTRTGLHAGKVEIIDYPLTYDNSYLLSYNVLPTVKTLAIHSGSASSTEGLQYMEALFKKDEYVQLEAMNIQNLKINRFSEFNVFVLLNPVNMSSGLVNELQKACGQGASILFFPDLQGNIEEYNQLLQAFSANPISKVDTSSLKLAGIAYSNPLFADIFKNKGNNTYMPQIEGRYRYANNTRMNETPLMWFANGKALSTVPYKEGAFYNFSFPLNSNNASFATSILFVPITYSLVLNSIPRQTISYEAGNTHFVLLKQVNFEDKNYPILIKNNTNGEEYTPEVMVSTANKLRLELGNFVGDAGHYSVLSNDSVVTILSFNYNRKESSLHFYSVKELSDEISRIGLKNIALIENSNNSFSEIFKEIQHGKHLWKWCILFALVFILSEALIIRFWK